MDDGTDVGWLFQQKAAIISEKGQQMKNIAIDH